MYVTPEYKCCDTICDLDRTIVVREQWTGAKAIVHSDGVPDLLFLLSNIRTALVFADFHPILERVSSGVHQSSSNIPSYCPV